MVYLSPLYSTSLLPSSAYFVKKWNDPRFCILSADEEEELLVIVKRMGPRYVNPMGRKDTRRGFTGLVSRGNHPVQAESKLGTFPVYHILSVSGAQKAAEEGAILTDEQGNYTGTHLTVPIKMPEGGKMCEAVMPGGDPCPHPASNGRLHCAVHQETSAISGRLYTAARYKQYLPEKLAKLYEEALSRPDLLEMENQIAVLDAKLMETFEETKTHGVPSWDDVQAEVKNLRDPDIGEYAIRNLEEYVRLGTIHDARWAHIKELMEQQRKMVDTEVRRKKELNLMIPVDRVMLLMASIADVIKRHVQDPTVLAQIKKEMGQLLNANSGQRPTVQVQSGDIISVD